MGVSAYQWAIERGERHTAGQIVSADGSYWWDRQTRTWRPFEAYAAAGVQPKNPPPSSAPELHPLVLPAVAAAAALGGLWWWWRR